MYENNLWPIAYICRNSLSALKRLTFTVINDLTYDQRMQRICTSLAEN